MPLLRSAASTRSVMLMYSRCFRVLKVKCSVRNFIRADDSLTAVRPRVTLEKHNYQRSPTRFLSLALLAAGLAPAQDSPPVPRTQSLPGLNQNTDDSDAPDQTADSPNSSPSLFGEERGPFTQRKRQAD